MIHRFNKKSQVIISTALIVTGLFLPIHKSNAQESILSALKDIAWKISSIFYLGGNKELSAEEKQQRDLQARKDTVSKIFDLTLMEQNDLKTRLAELAGLNSTQEKMRDLLTDQLAENENSFSQIRARLDTAKTIEEIKQLATDFKNWRTLVYDLKVKKIVPFTFVFQEENVITTAQQRLEKISNDFNGRKESLGENKVQATALFEKASSDIKKAKDLHSQAKILIMVALTNQANLISTRTIAKSINDEITRDIADSKTFTENSLWDVSDAYSAFMALGQMLK